MISLFQVDVGDSPDPEQINRTIGWAIGNRTDAIIVAIRNPGYRASLKSHPIASESKHIKANLIWKHVEYNFLKGSNLFMIPRQTADGRK